MASELRRHFHERLMAVRADVGTIAAQVVASVRRATDTLLESDTETAALLIEADHFIDEQSRAVEREVLDLVALQAPVARELRFLLASQRVAQELQLSGHLATGIAQRVAAIGPDALSNELRAVIYEMGAAATELTERAVHAYLDEDAALASDISAGVAHVADLHRGLLRELFATDPGMGVEPIVELGLIARFYERIADHAEVIAERVRFIGGR
jgi:phosphate transport system protein